MSLTVLLSPAAKPRYQSGGEESEQFAGRHGAAFSSLFCCSLPNLLSSARKTTLSFMFSRPLRYVTIECAVRLHHANVQVHDRQARRDAQHGRIEPHALFDILCRLCIFGAILPHVAKVRAGRACREFLCVR